ncbi:hypothetical protein HPB47_010480 [Ixodes persulcatus]|uniref:Uncharacterized protein n=1 Tax=Ixodes persulcatus TaxID=34615 RepID=A0AC60NYY8_IXOPE|nr:hypothetical protein HPB47_010480 [Ixodes persulcatus]
MPRLPKEHFRVIVRPRGGINVKNVSQVKIAQALVTAAGLSFTNAAEDTICPNAVQNILVVSTPSDHNAKAYARVEAISIGSAIYEMVELRSARKCEASQPPQAPKPAREETSMEVPVEFNALEARVGSLEARRGTMEFCAPANNEPSPTENPASFGAQHLQAASPSTHKGDDLWQAAANHDLTLVTDPAFPTRIGNSCSRDTTPDLTFVKNVGAVSRHNLNEDLGSDHNILATCINVKSKPLKEFTITDWDQFRKSREERALIQDSRLAHLLEAKQALLDRWKGQRLNRRLRKKIAELHRTIEDHCQSLTRQQWDEVCNTVDGQMRVGGKWNLLKDSILDALTNKYQPIGTSNPADYPSYKGPPLPGAQRAFHRQRGQGKHVIHNRISRHIEGKNLFPYNMIGFRPSLSTQDAMKLLKHQIFNKNTRDLLLYRPIRRGPKPKGWMPLSEVDITIRTNTGNSIPRVDVLRVLGMLIESNGCNSRTINKITTKTENMIRLINRVSNRRGGVKEDNLLRLFHAFLMSHFTYVAAMHCWHGHGKKLDTLIRKSIKRVLGIPMQASTERLMQLGVHNTLEEIIEAQETAQVARLSSSPAGRKILAVLGLNPTLVAERRHQLSDAQRASIQTSPFPRNVHPQDNVGRRRARAVALLRHVRDDTSLGLLRGCRTVWPLGQVRCRCHRSQGFDLQFRIFQRFYSIEGRAGGHSSCSPGR